jgi:hypothetical protein
MRLYAATSRALIIPIIASRRSHRKPPAPGTVRMYGRSLNRGNQLAPPLAIARRSFFTPTQMAPHRGGAPKDEGRRPTARCPSAVTRMAPQRGEVPMQEGRRPTAQSPSTLTRMAPCHGKARTRRGHTRPEHRTQSAVTLIALRHRKARQESRPGPGPVQRSPSVATRIASRGGEARQERRPGPDPIHRAPSTAIRMVPRVLWTAVEGVRVWGSAWSCVCPSWIQKPANAGIRNLKK